MAFSILTWNVWYLNQIENKTRLKRLLQELKSLIDQYQPDCIALCEAVQPLDQQSPPIIEHLEKLGYSHHHYARMAHIGDYWMSGVVLSSRFQLSNKQRHVISKNGSAARYGYPGIDKEIISVAISIPQGPNMQIIVAHPSALIDSIKQHVAGKRSLEKLIHSEPFTQNTILLGDMNEWRFLPGSLRSRARDIMYARTGSILNPTWRHNASRFTPLRLNLDYIYWSKQSDFYLKDFKVLSSKVSDHQPLLATFKYSS